MENITETVTGITVSYDAPSLLKNAVESFRKFHPDLRLIIVDGSAPGSPCYNYASSLADGLTKVVLPGWNIGHGRGMDMAIRMCETKYALIFDSDIEMIKSPVQQMVNMMEDDTYGIGYLEKTAYDGFEYGAKREHKHQSWMFMLHPFFHLLQVENYFKFYPYVHHGAPCFKAARDIHLKGLTHKIIKTLPGLGHTGGEGWNWKPVTPEWVIHNTAGTRNDRKRKGKPEIDPGWER